MTTLPLLDLNRDFYACHAGSTVRDHLSAMLTAKRRLCTMTATGISAGGRRQYCKMQNGCAAFTGRACRASGTHCLRDAKYGKRRAASAFGRSLSVAKHAVLHCAVYLTTFRKYQKPHTKAHVPTKSQKGRPPGLPFWLL